MGILRLRQSLCGCTLETGSLIIAWLGTIGLALEILIGTLFFVIGYPYIEEKVASDHNLSEDEVEKAMFIIKVGAGIVFVFTSLFLTIQILLLFGIQKRNPCLMTPWIIIGAIGVVLNLLALLLQFIASFTSLQMFVGFIFQLLFSAFGIYCYLIIYSFYCEVKEEKQMNDSRFKHINLS